MDVYYRDESAPKGTPQEVARMVRLRNNVAEVEAVLREFFHLEDGAWINDVCEENLIKMTKAANIARENGARSGGRPVGAKDKAPRKPKPARLAKDKTNQEPDGLSAGYHQDADGNQTGSQNKPAGELPITHNPLHSAPIGAGAAAPVGAVDNLLIPPDRFPPVDELLPPPGPPNPPAAPTPPAPTPRAPAAPLLPADGLFSAATGPFVPRPMSDFTDVKAEIWGVGKDWLLWCGINHEPAGKMIGKWLRDARDAQIVRDGIFAGIEVETRDPKSYVGKFISEANVGRAFKDYPGSLKGMKYGVPKGFIEGFPEANLDMSEWDDK